jgi:hypothetical protein
MLSCRTSFAQDLATSSKKVGPLGCISTTVLCSWAQAGIEAARKVLRAHDTPRRHQGHRRDQPLAIWTACMGDHPRAVGALAAAQWLGGEACKGPCFCSAGLCVGLHTYAVGCTPVISYATCHGVTVHTKEKAKQVSSAECGYLHVSTPTHAHPFHH